MSIRPNNRGASGVAIASFVLGIVTLLVFWVPILHLIPGLLALAVGTVALRRARRGTAGGKGLASLGMGFAVAGMLPSIIAAGDLTIAGVQSLVRRAPDPVILPEDATLGVTLSILGWYSHERGFSVGKVALNERPKGYLVKPETYYVDADGQRTDFVTRTFSDVSKPHPFSAVKRILFEWESPSHPFIRYKGTLDVTSPEALELSVDLENELPCQFAVEGLRDVAVRESGGQPLDLDEPLSPGKHSLQITGVPFWAWAARHKRE